MATSPENNKFEQVIQKIDSQSKLLRTWELQGGVSAQMTAIEIEQRDGQKKKLIVRLPGELDLKSNPQVAADEFKLLQQLHSLRLAVPTPYYFDQSGEIFSIPYLVIEYIEGKTEFAPSDLPDFLLQFTTQLSRIHAVDYAKLDVSFLPKPEYKYAKVLRTQPANLDESLDEGHMRDMLEVAWPFPQYNKDVFLHGDFWPGNLLWKDGQLLAVIDWEDAAIGDPLIDIANSRLELLWAFGPEAMQQFTQQYLAMTSIDFTNLPYWELCVALRRVGQISEWGLDDTTEKNMREKHRWFTRQAFEKLPLQ